MPILAHPYKFNRVGIKLFTLDYISNAPSFKTKPTFVGFKLTAEGEVDEDDYDEKNDPMALNSLNSFSALLQQIQKANLAKAQDSMDKNDDDDGGGDGGDDSDDVSTEDNDEMNGSNDGSEKNKLQFGGTLEDSVITGENEQGVEQRPGPSGGGGGTNTGGGVGVVASNGLHRTLSKEVLAIAADLTLKRLVYTLSTHTHTLSTHILSTPSRDRP